MNTQKQKIITKNKYYPAKDSLFYKLSSKGRLAKLVSSTVQELKSLTKNDQYHCFTQSKRGKTRPIQEPLPKLDKIHSRIASLLCRIETADGLHSGRKGRSNISNASAHIGVGKKVITLDIKNFFPSTKRSSVFDFFYNTMCCSPDIADLLSHICTYDDHIPTGSRLSMPLAYFANKRMFDEMEQTANECNAKMTIYVDDLTFSGEELSKNFITRIELIAKKYGHKINSSKTRFYAEDAVKLVTGVAVIDNQLKPRNKHLEALFKKTNDWQVNKSMQSRNCILGYMTYLGSIDSRYKDRARTFRQKAIF
ncbi:RNA-directed DNA polymerase [Legionella sp. km535]|uniref:reverse transcriptase family protein n=1 Tax=Legionella sp. km535 TaxID=2498107 RepID=UPI000F8C3621|nr:reverse transcriptase family protein [Legionella sp. km535]RUR19901.1 RNA-directed DNA polymerase [Legionella sp. km535]